MVRHPEHMPNQHATGQPAGPQTVMLPLRPQLLPGLQVLERGADEIQIGLDPRHGIVASGLPPGVIDALRALDGRRTVHNLLALAESEHTERLRDVLTGLTELGLLSEADPPTHSTGPGVETGLWSLRSGQSHSRTKAHRADCAVVIKGNGRLAIAVGMLLATAGVGHVDVASNGIVTEHDVGSGYLDADVGVSRRKAAAEALQRANPATRTRRVAGGDRLPELVLLTDAVVPAPELVNQLFHDGIPHLPVRVRDGVGIVGPLVVPGRTSCLRCADLHRTALDPGWPRIAGQLAGHSQQTDLADVQACAALAAAQTLRVLSPDQDPPPVWNATLEIDSFAAKVRHRGWPPHPRCPCRAR
jgi:hypothetical protein